MSSRAVPKWSSESSRNCESSRFQKVHQGSAAIAASYLRLPRWTRPSAARRSGAGRRGNASSVKSEMYLPVNILESYPAFMASPSTISPLAKFKMHTSGLQICNRLWHRSMVRNAFDVRGVNGNIIGNFEEIVEVGDLTIRSPGKAKAASTDKTGS